MTIASRATKAPNAAMSYLTPSGDRDLLPRICPESDTKEHARNKDIENREWSGINRQKAYLLSAVSRGSG